ncbi:MAG: filamentous hemagglutinin N-terminal domain-containing protein [Pleurocapsa sp. MO_192.B19]|nr:filamentous hemagglutinin N-terminal domain-containing protein [Pleurocapsa sp. MO_192.B19]
MVVFLKLQILAQFTILPMPKVLSPLFQISLCTLGYFYVSSEILLAQVTSDNTVDTQVNQNGNVSEITGGQTRGSNLFHSFQDFSVGTGNEAFFNNANDISNIFSRVTGGNISNIDGLIRANGSASLFLINPAGILFGENASLDIGGSFYGSSASSILFEDGEFSAADLENPPLLTVNAPIGLGFRDEPGNIVNNSLANNGRGLEVNSGNSISLLGGNVNFNGGTITAPGGIINLGGLAATGEISIESDNSLSFPDDVDKSNIELTNDSTVFVAADGGGFINVNAKNLLLADASELIAGIGENMGSVNAQAGNINVNATESVRIIGSDDTFAELQTGIRNNVGDRSIVRTRRDNEENQNLTSSAIGNGGAININTKLLDFKNDGKVSTVSYGRGNAGDINIVAENISIGLGTIESFSREGAVGNSGDITITAADTIFIDDSSEIQAQIFADATGNVGNIQIDTGSLTLNEFSFIQADTNNGVTANAGNIIINARESIALKGFLSLIISQIQEGGIGDAGEIRITASSLSLSDFSLISTNVKQNTIGSAGNIFINVNNLNITDGAVIDSLTENDFPGGNISLDANQINLSNGGKIVTSADNAGDAGSINLNVNDTLSIDNENPAADPPFFEQILQDTGLETGIFASTIEESTGDGGIINIQSGSIELVNNGSISAATQAGVGGNITFQVAEDLTLKGNSSISAQAFNNANGGNLDIDARFIVAFPDGNNDIIANAEQGQGGNITINAESLFGIQERPLNDSTNDIDASSEFNLDGTVNINTPDLNPIQGATELPNNVLEAEQTTAQACNADRESVAQNSLILKGKGGLPAAPDLPLNSANISINGENTNSTSAIPQPIETSQGKIQPARGIMVTESGEVILTAYRTNNAGNRLPQINLNCS